jgi:hypothetical protein
VGLIWWTLARKSPVRSVGIDIVAHRITVQLATYRRQEPLSIRSTKRQHSRPYVTWSSKACSLCPFGSLSCDRTVGGTQRGTSWRIPHQIANPTDPDSQYSSPVKKAAAVRTGFHAFRNIVLADSGSRSGMLAVQGLKTHPRCSVQVAGRPV